jgi:hypothetical protein
MRRVAGDAGAEWAPLRRVIGVRLLVTTNTSALRTLLGVVGIVTIRASGVRFHHLGAERWMSSVAPLARFGCGTAQIVIAMTTRACLMAAGKGGVLRNEGRVLAVAIEALSADLGSRPVRLMTIEALLVVGPTVFRARAMMQVDSLMATAAGRWVETLLTVRLMAIQARLVSMHDYGRVRSLLSLVTIETLVGLVKGNVGSRVA